MRAFVSDNRAALMLSSGRHGPMVKVVLRLAVSAAHNPEAAVRIIIALKLRHQFVSLAGRARELMELNT
jgi:hypothetical protein